MRPRLREAPWRRRGRDGLAEVVAVVYAGNEPSLRVCQRLDMEPTGSTQKWYGIELESFRIRRPA